MLSLVGLILLLPFARLGAQPDSTVIQVCVVGLRGNLTNISASYNTATGDTTIAGERFSTAYPGTTGYAAGSTWYLNNDAITVNGRRYVKYGLPRVLSVNEVVRVGDHQGVAVFGEVGTTTAAEIIYIPVRPGCEFQPYQFEVKVVGIRGDGDDVRPDRNAFPSAQLRFRVRGSTTQVFDRLLQQLASWRWRSDEEIDGAWRIVVTEWDYEPTAPGVNRDYRSSHMFTIKPGPGSGCSEVTLSWIVQWKGTMSYEWPGGISTARTPRRNAQINQLLSSWGC